ncbi:hypothetical protein [Mesorhizobium sp. KR9-304]|uniref:hypothetical protein n=1 Tax=Mesorhizobium sp. KR9-304 TaxID=3156614 RepID=UPI0032B604DE
MRPERHALLPAIVAALVLLSPAARAQECIGENCAAGENVEECTGENCAPNENVEECTGENCLPPSENGVIDCEGENCTPQSDSLRNPFDNCDHRQQTTS